MTDRDVVCSIPGCGRPFRALGLCQTHYKHLKKTGTPRPIRPMRLGRKGTVKLQGRHVTVECARKLKCYAKQSGWTINGAVTEILEVWYRRRERQAGSRISKGQGQRSRSPGPRVSARNPRKASGRSSGPA